MTFENISNNEKISDKNNLIAAVQLIENYTNSIPVITSKQIKNNIFPESNLARGDVMGMLFPNVDKNRAQKKYNDTHARKLKVLLKSGVLVRNPDIDNNRDSRYFLNENRLDIVLRNIERENQKIQSLHVKQYNYYFQ